MTRQEYKEILDKHYNDDVWDDDRQTLFRFTFSEPVSIYKKRCKARKVYELHVYKDYGYYYKTRSNSRRAYPINERCFAVDRLVSIEPVNVKDTMPSHKEVAEKIVSKIHPNAWPHLRDGLVDNAEEDYLISENRHKNGPKFRYIRGLIPRHHRDEVMAKIEEAFEEEKEYSWSKRGERRDYSIEVQPRGDGKGVHAWFSSEYAGCLNGDYYLLLNPTTAVFAETD